MRDDLPTVFEHYAKELLAKQPQIQAKWEFTEDNGKRLTICKLDDLGFDVIVEAKISGLYPYAGDWHGPVWEMGANSEELCREFMGFVRSLLCEDSSLEVKYAGSWPYKWILSYPLLSGCESLETGLFLYNYFGRRSSRIFKNRHLPPRYR